MCRTTEMSEACDSSDFDANTILLRNDDIGFNENVSISGLEFMKFNEKEKNLKLLSLVGNKIIPTAIAVGEKET